MMIKKRVRVPLPALVRSFLSFETPTSTSWSDSDACGGSTVMKLVVLAVVVAVEVVVVVAVAVPIALFVGTWLSIDVDCNRECCTSDSLDAELWSYSSQQARQLNTLLNFVAPLHHPWQSDCCLSELTMSTVILLELLLEVIGTAERLAASPNKSIRAVIASPSPSNCVFSLMSIYALCPLCIYVYTNNIEI